MLKALRIALVVLASAASCLAASTPTSVQTVRSGPWQFTLHSDGKITVDGWFRQRDVVYAGTGAVQIAAVRANLFRLQNDGTVWFHIGHWSGSKWVESYNGRDAIDLWSDDGFVNLKTRDGQIRRCADPSGGTWIRVTDERSSRRAASFHRLDSPASKVTEN